MNWIGVSLGLFAALAIGVGFIWVIRFEYLVGAYRWKWVLGLGLSVIAASLIMPNFILAAMLGIVGGSIAWGAVELPHQEERVDHGLFKAHPERASRPRVDHGHESGDHGHKPGLGRWWSF